MKTWKMMMAFATALLSTFTMTSCLGDSSSSSGPDYYNIPVTVVNSGLYGTYFYADMGSTFVPTSASLSQLTLTNVKRAMIGFTFVDETQSASSIQAGKSYNVVLDPSYCYSIPTYDIANDYNNEAADSLATRQTGISSASTNVFYVANGYLTTYLTLPYSSNTAYSLSMVYNSEEDIDVDNNTLTLNLQYAHNATSAYYTGSAYFSFKMPSDVTSKFQSDSVNVVMRALLSNTTETYQTLKTKAALSDLISKY
jgi:hypothetical protein